MRFRIRATGPAQLNFLLEPSGAEYVLAPGDYFEFWWEESDAPPIAEIVVTPDGVTVSEGRGLARMWDSSGDELAMF